MKYVWGAKVWHKLYGYGPGPLSSNSLITACSSVAPRGRVAKMASAPAAMCSRCANWTAAQQAQFRQLAKVQVTSVDPG